MRNGPLHRDDQSITVSKGDRELTVAEGRLTETVNKSITRESVTGDQMFQTHGTFLSLAKRNVMHSDEYLELHVGPLGGGSSIVMTPSCIVLQAPRVFINPGQEATELARNGGAIPSGEEERQVLAAQEAARIEAEAQQQADEAEAGRMALQNRAQEIRQRRLEARQRPDGSGQAARVDAEAQQQAGAAEEGRLAQGNRAQEIRQRRLERRQGRGGSGQGGAP